MKVIKYFLALSIAVLGFTSCDNGEPKDDATTNPGQEQPTPPAPTQDEIEQLWPDSIITAEVGEFILVKRDTTSNKLRASFYMCTKEVTQAQWEAIMGTNPSDNEYIKEGANIKNCPVNNIKYSEAKAFVKALNEITGRKFAIPSETQWEWAAMGGLLSNGYKYSGSDTTSEVAWSAVDYDYTLNEVAQLQPNELGIYDMSGNIAEWTSASNTIRGGHYETEDPEELEVTYSSKMNVDAPYIVGIRLILEEPLESELLDEEELKAKLEEEKQETDDSIVEEK